MLPVPLGTREFEALRAIIMDAVGILIADSKRTLLEGRLARRLRKHNFTSYEPYVKLLRDDRAELAEMVNAVTTNKTAFFREDHHFTYLEDLLQSRGKAAPPMQIWSAGCSSGEEPYSIAIAAGQAATPVRITATDVDTSILETAAAGVYGADRQDGLSEEQKRRFFLRGVGAQAGSLRVKPELQRQITFRQLNLIAPSWPLNVKFDIIFCRNVVIYFDRPTQEKLFRRYASQLVPGGLLILGHSESVNWLPDLFESIGQTMYRAHGAGGETMRPATARALAKPLLAPRPQVAAAPLAAASAPAIVKRIDAGDIFASATPAEVRTVLGSCVAACLYDPVSGVGGMNHFMLADGESADRPARYGVHAMELLINDIMKHGGDRRRLRAKVFGGASVIRMASGAVDVGGDNVKFIRRFLEAERIPVEGEKLGGTRPLEVRMDTATGRVRVRALGADTLRDLSDKEHAKVIRQQRAITPQRDVDVADVLF